MLERDVVVPGLEVYHADPFGAAKIRAIAPRIVQLIVALVCSLIDGYNVLADPGYPDYTPGTNNNGVMHLGF